jgi:hypothetical protein
MSRFEKQIEIAHRHSVLYCTVVTHPTVQYMYRVWDRIGFWFTGLTFDPMSGWSRRGASLPRLDSSSLDSGFAGWDEDRTVRISLAEKQTPTKYVLYYSVLYRPVHGVIRYMLKNLLDPRLRDIFLRAEYKHNQ